MDGESINTIFSKIKTVRGATIRRKNEEFQNNLNKMMKEDEKNLRVSGIHDNLLE